MGSLAVTVIGTGYLGVTHAVCMAELGFDVLGLDIDSTRVDTLAAGVLPFFEPGLEPLLRKHVEGGRLRFTTSYDEIAHFGDVHFLCVGTPQKRDGYGADVSHIDAAVGALAPNLRRPCLVVGRSTVPVGTAERVAAQLTALSPVGAFAELAWNPEFLREGFALADSLRPDRLVFGVQSDTAEARLREVYRALIEQATPVVVCDFATAELVKMAANAFLATKISFINAMAELCEATGADVTRLSAALAYDERIGGRFLHAGLGFGGGCLPKDIRAFMARAGELGVDQALTFLREVDSINLRRRARMVDLARELVGGAFDGMHVCVLGAAFKPNSDDVRDSPALDVAAAVRRAGASVAVYDPEAMEKARQLHPELDYSDSAFEAARGADLVLHLTEWREFREMEPAALAAVVASPRIVDGRNALDAEKWRAAGWTYRALGRP